MQKVLASVLGGATNFQIISDSRSGRYVRVANPSSVTFLAAYHFFSIELGLAFVAISNLGVRSLWLCLRFSFLRTRDQLTDKGH
jgi:hypothetical protein